MGRQLVLPHSNLPSCGPAGLYHVRLQQAPVLGNRLSILQLAELHAQSKKPAGSGLSFAVAVLKLILLNTDVERNRMPVMQLVLTDLLQFATCDCE